MSLDEKVAKAMYQYRDVQSGYDYGPFEELPPINKGQYLALAKVAIQTIHDDFLEMGRCVSNTGAPYFDNDHGRAALTILRCMDPTAANAEVNEFVALRARQAK